MSEPAKKRKPGTTTRAKQLIKALEETGHTVGGVSEGPDGEVRVLCANPAESCNMQNKWDEVLK